MGVRPSSQSTLFLLICKLLNCLRKDSPPASISQSRCARKQAPGNRNRAWAPRPDEGVIRLMTLGSTGGEARVCEPRLNSLGEGGGPGREIDRRRRSEESGVRKPPRFTWHLHVLHMYGYESWTVKKAERQRIDAFELWCWRGLLRVPWTARRSNQFIVKEISPGCSLEGLMLRLKLQYFGHSILMCGRTVIDLGVNLSSVGVSHMNVVTSPALPWEVSR